ncbi:MAG: WG repeat-containing protein [Bacteroidales bacterium]|nr:WG repeat-containing protein [Bacteroidales bacterium]
MKIIKKGKFLAVIMLICLTLASLNSFAQYYGLQTENDGFSWYRVGDFSKDGAKSANDTWIIPLSRGYSDILYYGGYFSVKKNNKEGICDKNGKEIIVPRYDNIVKHECDGIYYFEVEFNGKVGACDINGREIVAPRYEGLICYDGVFEYKDASGNYVSTGISIDGKSRGSSYASTSSSSNSSSTSTVSNTESGLLYEGDYTEGPWMNPNTGYSQPAPMPNHHIKIYEDHIIIDMVSLPYQGKSINGEKMYVNSWSNITYYVDGFYNIRSTFPYGYSQFSKGNVVYDMNAPVQGGYDNNNNNSYGTTPQKHEHGTREVTETCPVCHSTGNCQTCLGRGWRTLTDNSTQQCPTCKGNKVCWKCNGTGKITKTERY